MSLMTRPNVRREFFARAIIKRAARVNYIRVIRSRSNLIQLDARTSARSALGRRRRVLRSGMLLNGFAAFSLGRVATTFNGDHQRTFKVL